MSKYKLSPQELLQLEKKRVQEERDISEKRMFYHLQYLNDNWGSLITKGVTSSLKSKISETTDNLVNSYPSLTPLMSKKQSPWLTLVMSNLPFIGSIVWRIAKPALMVYATKKITSSIFSGFGKRKKKK